MDGCCEDEEEDAAANEELFELAIRTLLLMLEFTVALLFVGLLLLVFMFWIRLLRPLRDELAILRGCWKFKLAIS